MLAHWRRQPSSWCRQLSGGCARGGSTGGGCARGPPSPREAREHPGRAPAAWIFLDPHHVPRREPHPLEHDPSALDVQLRVPTHTLLDRLKIHDSCLLNVAQFASQVGDGILGYLWFGLAHETWRCFCVLVTDMRRTPIELMLDC